MRPKLAGIIVAAMSFATAQSAFSADMPVKAPAAAGIPWTGFYVSGGIGYGAWTADQTSIDPATGLCTTCVSQTMGGKGWLATVGAGYDYQFTSRIVSGVFGDASLSSLKGTLQDGFLSASEDIKQTSSWAVGARVGWLVTPQTMSYVNGGYTGARFSGTDLVSATSGASIGVSTSAFTANGGFIGGGIETSVAPGWFWKNEYRYAYYGNGTVAETPGISIITFKPTVQTVTSQITYKFNGGLPAPVYPSSPAIATNWTGFYGDLGAGYGLWAANSTQNIAGTPICIICVTQVVGGKGYLGRLGAGYDVQFAPIWVVGVFGDFDLSSLKGTLQDDATGNSGVIKQTSAFAVGPRVGWLPSPQTMTYATGGYTGARFSGTNMVVQTTGAPTGTTTPGFTTSGWFVGGGVETAFDFFGSLGRGWFWRSEYRYADYRDRTFGEILAGVPLADIAFKPTVQTVTSSIVFKFN